MSILRYASQVDYYANNYIAAFRKGELAGVKDIPATDVRAEFAEPGWWREAGNVDDSNTLWWGRGKDGQLWVVGFESSNV